MTGSEVFMHSNYSVFFFKFWDLGAWSSYVKNSYVVVLMCWFIMQVFFIICSLKTTCEKSGLTNLGGTT